MSVTSTRTTTRVRVQLQGFLVLFLGRYLPYKRFQRTAPIMVAAAGAAGLAAKLRSRSIVAPQAGAA